MKKNTLVALGLVSMISLGMAAGTVKAEEKTAVSNSTGTVGFTTEFPVTPPPGPGTGPEIIPPNPGNGDNDLNILYVTDFNFGEANVFKGQDMNLDAYSNTYYTYEKDAEGNIVNGPDGKPLEKEENAFQGPLGISIGNTKAYRDWSLQVEATAFADAEKKELNGLEMTITPAEVNNVVGNTSVDFNDKVIKADGTSVTEFATATGVDTETMAVTNIPFGEFTVEDATKPERYENGVSLFVPGTAEIENDTTYTSTITWTLSATAI